MNPLPQTTIDRIEREAVEKYPPSGAAIVSMSMALTKRRNYIEGATTEATRALPLYEALKSARALLHINCGECQALKDIGTALAFYDAGEAPEPGKEAKEQIPPRVAFQVLAVKQALVEKNIEEAYHQLYQIASPDFNKYEPWAELEELAKQWQQSKNQQR